MFVGSFVVQWGIGVVVDAMRAGVRARRRRAGCASRSRSCSSAMSRRMRGSRAAGSGIRLRSSFAAHRPKGSHAPAHPRHLRHVHGRPRRHREARRAHASPAATPTSIRRCRRSWRRSASPSPKAGTPRSCGVARDADVFVDRQRRVARQSADGGDPRRRPALRLRAAVAVRDTCSHDHWVLAVAGTHGKTTTTAMLAWILEHAGLAPGLPDRRRAAGLSGIRAAHRQRVLRHRGRRVRHGVLRQALEVRPLPAAHGDPQQPRVRPRRHLPRPRGDRDAVPSPRAHGAAAGPHRRQRRRGQRRARARARLLVRGRALRPGRGSRHRARTGRSPMDGTILLGGAPQGTLRVRTAGPAQPAERAGRTRGGAPRRRPGRRTDSRRSRVSPACKRRLEDRAAPCAASPSTTTSRIIRRPSPRRSTGCAATSAPRASSPCSSRARTR